MLQLTLTLLGLFCLSAHVAAKTISVDIENFEFVPADITAAFGDTIEWTNKDSAAHTVTSTDGTSFDSGNMEQGATFNYVVDYDGTLEYLCVYHNFMEGSVTGAEFFYSIVDFEYLPLGVSGPELIVETGTTVYFFNDDTVVHTVTSGAYGTTESGDSFDMFLPSDSFGSYTFDTSGVVPFHCAFHPSMVNKVFASDTPLPTPLLPTPPSETTFAVDFATYPVFEIDADHFWVCGNYIDLCSFTYSTEVEAGVPTDDDFVFSRDGETRAFISASTGGLYACSGLLPICESDEMLARSVYTTVDTGDELWSVNNGEGLSPFFDGIYGMYICGGKNICVADL